MEPPRIHNLTVLASRCGLTIAAEQRGIVDELDNMGVVTRYPDGRRALASSLTGEKASAIYPKTQEFSAWLRQELS